MSKKTNRLKNRMRIEQDQAASRSRRSQEKISEQQREIVALRDKMRRSHITLDIQRDFDRPDTFLLRSQAASFYSPNDELAKPQMIAVKERISVAALQMARHGDQILANISHEIATKLVDFMRENKLMFMPNG